MDGEVDPRRAVPALARVLARPEVQDLVLRHGHEPVTAHLRGLLEDARSLANEGRSEALAEALGALPATLEQRLEQAQRPSLRAVLNATGIVVHTNLGRAPLSAEAARRVAEAASSPTNLEFDLDTGDRGDRETHIEPRVQGILGAESSLVVNNCAAAVLLAVNTLAEGREVLVSRSELVEIGGSFRIPEILRKGGARLVEVGTTNRTRIADYRAAAGRETALILRVHPSNFRIVGFTEAPALVELVGLAREMGVPMVEDLGSGLLEKWPGPLGGEPSAREALDAGVDALTMSGDKLLGGPQAGLVVGGRQVVEAMRRNPLYRALRVDKMTMAALHAVLVDHASGQAHDRVPVHRMIALAAATIRERALGLEAALLSLRPSLRTAIIDGESRVGGGAAPNVALPTALLAIAPPFGALRLATNLRHGQPPVVIRIGDDRALVDLRTVDPAMDATLARAIASAVDLS